MQINHNEDLIINLYLNDLLDEEAESSIKEKINSDEEFSKKVFTHALLIKVQQDEELRTEIEKELRDFSDTPPPPPPPIIGRPTDPIIKLEKKFIEKLAAMAIGAAAVVIIGLFWLQSPQQELTLQLYEGQFSDGEGNSMLSETMFPTNRKVKIFNDEKGKETFRFESDSVLHISLNSQQVGSYHEYSRLAYYAQDSTYRLYFDLNGWKLKGKEGKLEKLPKP